MHDLAAAQELLRVVLRGVEEHAGRRVVTISVKVGDRMGVDPRRLEELVQALAEGTVAEGAELDTELVGGGGLVVDSFEIE